MFRSLIIAFSMYSRIPMPVIEWKEEDMRYVMVFFPFVGIITGIAFYLCYTFCSCTGFSHIFTACLCTAIPFLLTGGIHFDGFMDTKDALSSLKPKEDRLKILSDPHIGAFAVIHTLILVLIYFGSLYEIINLGLKASLILICTSFWYSRILSALSVLYLKIAKEDSSLSVFRNSTKKKTAGLLLITELLLSLILMGYISLAGAFIVFIVSVSVSIIYRIKSYKHFGGITGDTSGAYLCIIECSIAFALAVSERFML